MIGAIVKRFKDNPILTNKDVPYPVATVHNAGMVKHDGRYMMLFRAHRRNGRSVLGLADSDDGLHFRVRPEPFMAPATEGVLAAYEEYGVEDPRICAMEAREAGEAMEGRFCRRSKRTSCAMKGLETLCSTSVIAAIVFSSQATIVRLIPLQWARETNSQARMAGQSWARGWGSSFKSFRWVMPVRMPTIYYRGRSIP